MSCIWGHAVKVSQKCGADPIARKTRCMSSKNWKVLFYRFQNFQADSIPKQVKNLSNIQYSKHSIHWSPNQEQHLWFKRSVLPGVLLGKPCVSRGPDRAQVIPQHVTPITPYFSRFGGLSSARLYVLGGPLLFVCPNWAIHQAQQCQVVYGHHRQYCYTIARVSPCSLDFHCTYVHSSSLLTTFRPIPILLLQKDTGFLATHVTYICRSSPVTCTMHLQVQLSMILPCLQTI